MNMPMGFHVIRPDYWLVIEKIETGYTSIALSWDTYFFGAKCREELERIKG
jgi:hypothetical protein